MRVSGKGREHLLVVIPLAAVITYAVIVNGGPGPVLTHVDRYLEDLFFSVSDWIKGLFS